MRILALVLSFISAPLWAHEFWLEPQSYQIPADGRLVADIVNGQDFGGSKLAYIPRRFEHFVMFSGNQTTPIEGRIGDTPALNAAPIAEGLHIVAYQARNATISYENWEKFQRFVDHKDFGNIRRIHDERGLPDADFSEVYSRYSKTLIGVGNGAGADMQTGLETEIVALTNPYTDDLSDGFRLQLFYRAQPRPNSQVEVFEKTPDGEVSVTFYRTDDAGIAVIDVQAGHSYMVDAVLLREPNAALAVDTGAVWETLWANLTFAVPQ